jgi:DNA-binding XRE family transcriptional regulator
MNTYVTGALIKKVREKKKMTQSELAEILIHWKTIRLPLGTGTPWTR